jgi:general secretion pathway protein J
MRTKRLHSWPRLRGNAGFTLVEVLAALLLFSLLASALFGIVRVDANAWTQVTSHADESDHRLHVQDLIRHLIADAYPLFLSADPANRRIDFVGRKDAMGFLTSVPMALGHGGRSRVLLAIEPRHDRVDLVFESDPELASENGGAEAARKPLLSGASAIAFSYFGRMLSERETRWHEDWIVQTELPQLVRVETRFPESEGGNWPDLIVSPRTTADVGCVVDRLTMRCQGR